MAVLTHRKQPEPPRRGLAALAALLLLAIGPPASAQGSGPALEYVVKANYLYKFAPFVRWPASAFRSSSSTFNVCVIGEDPFGRVLDDAVAGQAVGGHPIAVRRPASASESTGCHVLYLGRTRGRSASDILRALRGAPVLTVTDQRSGEAGGMVHFVLRDGRVRFTLDVRAAQASGLGLGSKLQALAASPRAGGG